MAKRNNAYWQKRMEALEDEQYRRAEAYEYSGRFYTPIPEIGNHRSDMKETAIPF